MFDLILLPDEQNRAMLHTSTLSPICPNDANLDAKGRGKR
jgi:hypothetical protein